MRVIHTRAKVHARLKEISVLSWSTSEAGVFSPATSHIRPYVWNDVLENVDDETFADFMSMMHRSASESPLAVDTLTAMDVAADTSRARYRNGRASDIIPELVEMPYAKFRFLMTIGHGSSHENHGVLVGDLVRHTASPRAHEQMSEALWRIRATLGSSAGDHCVAPHYVADVVSSIGVRNLLRLFGERS